VNARALMLWRRLREAGLDIEVRELEGPPPTLAGVAAALGCEPGQIVSSELYVVRAKPLLVLCAGDRQVDLATLGERAALARPDQVRSATGYVAGGVPPLLLPRPLPMAVDASLGRFDTVWCSAGVPEARFEIGFAALLSALPDAELRELTVAAAR
jgi:prolyl-tRNA editing enzyme YbaK/EbsC (Cys-tRNA(Pro) deacylase)